MRCDAVLAAAYPGQPAAAAREERLHVAPALLTAVRVAGAEPILDRLAVPAHGTWWRTGPANDTAGQGLPQETQSKWGAGYARAPYWVYWGKGMWTGAGCVSTPSSKWCGMRAIDCMTSYCTRGE
jgi:hypothetical protein